MFSKLVGNFNTILGSFYPWDCRLDNWQNQRIDALVGRILNTRIHCDRFGTITSELAKHRSLGINNTRVRIVYKIESWEITSRVWYDESALAFSSPLPLNLLHSIKKDKIYQSGV